MMLMRVRKQAACQLIKINFLFTISSYQPFALHQNGLSEHFLAPELCKLKPIRTFLVHIFVSNCENYPDLIYPYPFSPYF